jgi:HPt (histidine-containing phosphotransfer) domain-containing protein
MTADDDLAAALHRLRADYLAAAPERIAELWTAYARVQNGGVQLLEGLGTLVHRLAGTGASYGLPAVTARAREADEACRQMIASRAPLAPGDMQRLRALLQGIADAFQDASFSE